MSVSSIDYLKAYTVTDEAQECSICLDHDVVAPSPQDWIVHAENGGLAHPFHRFCLSNWLAQHENCPNCRQIFSKRQIECLTALSPKALNYAEVDANLYGKLEEFINEVLEKEPTEKRAKEIQETALELLLPFIDSIEVTVDILGGFSSQISPEQKKMLESLTKNLLTLQKQEIKIEKKHERADKANLFLTALFHKVERIFVRFRIQREILSSFRGIKGVLSECRRSIERQENLLAILPNSAIQNVGAAKRNLEKVENNLKIAQKVFEDKEGKSYLNVVASLLILSVFLLLLLLFSI